MAWIDDVVWGLIEYWWWWWWQIENDEFGLCGMKIKKDEGRGEMAVAVCLGPLGFLFFSFFSFIHKINN